MHDLSKTGAFHSDWIREDAVPQVRSRHVPSLLPDIVGVVQLD